MAFSSPGARAGPGTGPRPVPLCMLHRAACWSSSTCFPCSSPTAGPQAPAHIIQALGSREDFVITEARGAEPVGGVWGEVGSPAPHLLCALNSDSCSSLPTGFPPSLFHPGGPAGCCRDAPLPRKAAPRQCLSLLSPWLLRLTIQGKAPRASRQGAGGSSLPPTPRPLCMMTHFSQEWDLVK